MHTREMVLEQGSIKKLFTALIISALCLELILSALQIRSQLKSAVNIIPREVPLLLNSGVVGNETADVNIVLWFQNCTIPRGILENKPTPQWQWSYKELSTENGNKAITISGHDIINKNEESNLYSWYTNMAQQMAIVGGHVYLDERIPQLIDVAAYLSKTSALPAQWTVIDNLVSIAAFQDNIEGSVMAGKDRVNIQLLSRGKKTEGQTVLALPVLLEEF